MGMYPLAPKATRLVGAGDKKLKMPPPMICGEASRVAADNAVAAMAAESPSSIVGADSLEGVVSNLQPQRAVWIMVPSGDSVDQTIASLSGFLQKGDILIDGGNSNFNDSVRRAEASRKLGFE